MVSWFLILLPFVLFFAIIGITMVSSYT
jgi:hypothetical protein